MNVLRHFGVRRDKLNFRLFQLATITLLLTISASSFADCKDWIARVVSMQGSVDVRTENTASWNPVVLQKVYCVGDIIRTGSHSRASLELHNETILRLNQNTTLVLSGPKKEASWLDLLKGSLHAITRVPRSLKIKTPFVNAAVEGTEFLVTVKANHTLVGVIEGKVAVSNQYGRLLLTMNQSALTHQGQAPVLRLDIKPTDSVQWSLYFPRTYSQHLGQAEHALSVGQIVEAQALLKNDTSAEALALRSIISVVLNHKDKAMQLITQALAQDKKSATVNIAYSYVLQANFKLTAARDAAMAAVQNNTQLAMAWARLAELHLSLGELEQGQAAAQRAADLDQRLSRAQTMLGFAQLLQYRTNIALQHFSNAIMLDSSDPLARLGQGLATIRNGSLAKGRRYIEIAASLDTRNALIRSYLGKAYFEEKRNKRAADQFALAKQLDPKDPTPWLYDAMRKQTENNPIGALHDLKKSIALNGNRAVYRSRFMLDDDVATRASSVGRIYQSLGFDELVLGQAERSLHVNSANPAAHRLLADAYLTKPRHEVARVSELLQSQLLQPLQLRALQPQMAESSLTLVNNLGNTYGGLNDYGSLFVRNQAKLGLSGLRGNNGLKSEEGIFSGLYDTLSVNVGRYNYQADGFHTNNKMDQQLFNLLVKKAISTRLSVLFEASSNDNTSGDIYRFDPDNYSQSQRNLDESDKRRIGFYYKAGDRSHYLFTATNVKRIQVTTLAVPFLGTSRADAIYDSNSFEMRYIYQGSKWSYTAGAGKTDTDAINSVKLGFFPPSTSLQDIVEKNIYLYSYLRPSSNLNLVLGLASGQYKGFIENIDERKTNPKLGLSWQYNNSLTLRAAWYQNYRRTLLNDQTIEPTTIAGFNQFYDDTVRSRSTNWGLGLDYLLNAQTWIRAELIDRNLDVPYKDATVTPAVFRKADWEERLFHLTGYWLPSKYISASFGVTLEDIKRGTTVSNNLKIADSKAYLLPLKLKWFHSANLRSHIGLTYGNQKGGFVNITTNAVVQGKDDFFVADYSLEYKLPKNMGSVSLGVLNLFDSQFRYQTIDSRKRTISPERVGFLKINFVF